MAEGIFSRLKGYIDVLEKTLSRLRNADNL